MHWNVVAIDPIELASMVKQMASYTARSWPHFDPIQLA